MWKVYSVKTLYRTDAIGAPKKVNEDYREDLVLIEERIVTLKARTFDEAILKGEKEAITYASETSHINPYGQAVQQEYIGYIDVFEPFEEVAPNIEVFSSTFLTEKSLPESEIIECVVGKEYENERQIRLKFLNREYSGEIK
jgi:hypothetical protein